ncbi:signal peptide peptidase SppA, 36K type [Sedimentisphaera cyanobacteriorum]|uniref:Signal peptide peptidase SppA, 36K type n=1 Tax=Sedimentisphaera cyanobacteriorum TaxID=1940790 RepID=A0A1Q2HRM5_9BACT|nr:hypothetical protein [Sedimentisphaera cyanobacteriorum]AQQ10118.1 signal peptide peptidase SppA, 36K type [Sedimentisphaera cyanobacteriorum]
MFRFILFTALTASLLFADTFTHSETGKVYNGFATQPDEDDKTWIVPEEGKRFEADLSEYKIEHNQKGRKNEIAVLEITYPIVSAMKTEAFEEAIAAESNKGPSAIIVEIDTPGGRVDLAKRLCSSIIKTSNCKTAAYIAGGQHGGAYSAGAAISMSCDKIYMAPGTVIGAATAIVRSRMGGASDMKNAFGEAVGEKFDSAWRNYMASIAEQSGRPAALAKAMAEQDTTVLEVSRDGKKLFIEPGRKIEGDEVKSVVVQKGSLLTLTAKKALKCNMADAICESRDYVVSELSDSKPEVAVSEKIKEAEEKLTASPGTAKLVAKNLKSKFPWLKNVRVQTSINRLTIDADYRKPAVLLRHKSAKYYISEDMTVLDYIPIDSLSVPEVSGVVLASAPSPGEPLFHEQIKASVKLTQLFRAMDKSRSRKFLKQVESIDVENYGITDSSIPQIVIKTKEELDIFWGAAPGDAEAYFEMPEKKKLAVLYTIFESHPNLKGRYENIDLRFEQ